jgi:glycosyltransferase involved in cell wall biosynthesis
VRVVIDGLAIRGENSLSIVSENLLSGWQRIDGVDELHLVLRSDPAISVPEGVSVHRVKFGRSAFASRLYAQSFLLPRLCRALKADVMLGMLPTTALTPLPCPRAVIAWDFRYRLLPQQFSRRSLLLRRVSYSLGFRRADAIACISERTKRDLLTFHHRLSKVPVEVTHLGADHVDSWPVRSDACRAEDRYAIAFGHFANKNVDLVLDAWSALGARGGPTVALRLVGVSERDRPRLDQRIDELGMTTVVTVSPWLTTECFREQFTSSSLVVFPSDFEGFGLPAVEAMRLGIPVIITPDPALLEVTSGHAIVVDGEGPGALARAVDVALAVPEGDLAAAKAYAQRFTWANFASGVRNVLAGTAATVSQTQVAHV